MHPLSSILALAMAAVVVAAVPAPLEQRAAVSCSTPDGDGTCGSTSAVCDGFFVAGYCPSPDTNQCCVPSGPDPDDTNSSGDDGAAGDVGPEVDADILPDEASQADIQAAEIEARDIEARAATRGQKIYATATKWLGTKYVWAGGNCGGPTKGGFDCSGLVLYAVCKVTGKKLPHRAQDQYHSSKGKHIPRSQAKQGDAIFWATNGNCKTGIKHVGIVKDAHYFINAPHTGAKVRVQKT